MSRFKTELDQISKLSVASPGTGMSDELRTMLVAAVVSVVLLTLPQWRELSVDEAGTKLQTGPLSSYLVTPKAQDQAACRSADCTFALTWPVTAQSGLARAVRQVMPVAASSPGQESGSGRTFHFLLAEAANLSLTAGDTVMLHFGQAQVADQMGGQAVAMKIAALAPEEPGAGLHLQLDFSGGPAERAALEQGISMGSMWLAFSPEQRATPDMLLRVPASAIVRNGKEAWVWLVMDEFAVPVRVREVERGAQFSLVTENTIGGARGMPVLPAHWRELSAYGRSRVFLAVRQPDKDNPNQLLGLQVPLIGRPNDKLHPGSKIRSVHASGQ